MTDFDLDIDPAEIKGKIVSFIKKITLERQASGLLVIFGGRIDSYVSAKLSIEALGPESVKLIVVSYASKSRRQEILSDASKHLELPEDTIISLDIEQKAKMLDSPDESYTKVNKGIHSHQRNIGLLLLRTHHVQQVFKEKTLDLLGKPESSRDEYMKELIAYDKLRKRLKSVLAYQIAEKENYLLVSKTNKTERLTGLFTKFGYGHAADIMPLADLYRTQELQLAEYLELPRQILDLAGTDILPGVENKYQHFFDLESSDVDKILVRMQADWPPSKISKELGITLDKVERVSSFFRISKYQRSVPLIARI